MDIIRVNALEADMIMACGPMPMLRAIKNMPQSRELPPIFLWRSGWPAAWAPVWGAYAGRRRSIHILMCIMHGSVRTDLYLKREKWRYDQEIKPDRRS